MVRLVAVLLLTSFMSIAFGGRVAYARTLSKKESKLIGSYRCASYNVSGGGSGNCRLMPTLVLKKNGSYVMSSERGMFRLVNGKLSLSGSKIRGKGEINAQASSIRFQYTYRGWRHVLTYAKESIPTGASQEIRTSLAIPQTIGVELTLAFDREDGSVSYINVITLVPQGDLPVSAPYRPEALALQEGKQTLNAFFTDRKEVTTGKVYDIYTSSGTEYRKVGSIDLTKADKPIKKTVIVSFPTVDSSEKETATASFEQANGGKQEQVPAEQQKTGLPCDPSIPHYAGGC